MQIIIPMSGVGQRFADAAYTTIKPLIKINNKPIIEYVIDFFAPADEFIFIINETHLTTTPIKEVLLNKVPNANIVCIPAHKQGPVYAVQQSYSCIDNEKPCIVNYCDFNMLWRYEDFLSSITLNEVDGAIPCYIGFHPHLLHPHNVYAGCLVNDKKKLLAIKEKFSFTINKMSSHHSVGTYYFKTGAMLKHYCDDLVERKHSLKGEYYVSMVYEQMLKEDKNVLVYDKLSHFCQWGTPFDLEEFNWWIEVFEKLPQFLATVSKSAKQSGNLLMPMAGNGQRFVDAGYTQTKPLIEVDNLPMYKNALSYLQKYDNNIIITKQPIAENAALVIEIKNITDGQAATCLLADRYINNDAPLMITPCDNAMLYNIEDLNELKKTADVIIFTFKGSNAVVSKPEQYGWVITDESGNVQKVSCKKQISNTPIKDNAVTGAFWFNKGSDFVKAATKMIGENRRINNEFYIDECINDCIVVGLIVKVFTIDKYICWGTPNDLRTYEYWSTYYQLSNY